MRNFRDRVAVVTGSASGIGRSLAFALAERGCQLALVDVQVDENEETAAAIRDRGGRATTHRVDVSDRGQMEALAQQIFGEFGRVDIVVNNAGVTVVSSFEEHSHEDLEWIIGVNLWGVLHGCRVFLPYLRQQEEAYIVNVSSVFGLVGVPEQTSYCLTKFAVRGFGEALAAELAGSPVRVLTVCPGAIATRIVSSGRWSTKNTGRRSTVVDFFARRGMSPDRAARRILDAMYDGRSRLLIAPEAYAIDAMVRGLGPIAPRLLARAQTWMRKLDL